mgnify:CR=1 FL=1
MAYSKVSNKTQDKDVKYLNKDYNSYKNQLMEFAEVYFPDSFNDFSEGNPGMMFLEMAAYVGDVLSFYTDTQLRESFLSLAQETISGASAKNEPPAPSETAFGISFARGEVIPLKRI